MNPKVKVDDVKKIVGLMERIYPGLEIVKEDYCIIGSAALLLSGIQTPVHDLDILTSSAGAEKLKKLWMNKMQASYRPENSERFRSVFARFDFDEHAVEVMGALEVNKTGYWQKVEVQHYDRIHLESKHVNVPTLEEQQRIFLLFGRSKDLEKIKLIEDHRAQ